jgi:hypothetical protein
MLPEHFIVKAIGPDGTRECWITTPRRGGLRTFGPRELAAFFVNWDGAEHAIREIQKSENCSEIIFEVHSVKSVAVNQPQAGESS